MSNAHIWLYQYGEYTLKNVHNAFYLIFIRFYCYVPVTTPVGDSWLINEPPASGQASAGQRDTWRMRDSFQTRVIYWFLAADAAMFYERWLP